MPLYRVTLEFEAYCWSDDDEQTPSDMEDEVLHRHAHSILDDQGPFECEISAYRVHTIKEVPKELWDSIPYGAEDDKTVEDLFGGGGGGGGGKDDVPAPDTKTMQMKCAHGHVIDACVACRKAKA